MIWKKGICAVLSVTILFIACLCLNNREVVLIIVQTVFSSYILLEFIMLLIFKYRLDSLYEDAYNIMIVEKRKISKAWILSYIIEYESVKAHNKIRLDSKIFKKMNDELEGKQLPSIEQHNTEELLSLIDELTDKIENEHLEVKRQLYKEYFKKILITPTNGNYEERKLFLSILGQVTPLQIELLVFLLDHPYS